MLFRRVLFSSVSSFFFFFFLSCCHCFWKPHIIRVRSLSFGSATLGPSLLWHLPSVKLRVLLLASVFLAIKWGKSYVPHSMGMGKALKRSAELLTHGKLPIDVNRDADWPLYLTFPFSFPFFLKLSSLVLQYKN